MALQLIRTSLRRRSREETHGSRPEIAALRSVRAGDLELVLVFARPARGPGPDVEADGRRISYPTIEDDLR